jgi:hypothetical protein
MLLEDVIKFLLFLSRLLCSGRRVMTHLLDKLTTLIPKCDIDFLDVVLLVNGMASLPRHYRLLVLVLVGR